MVWDDSEKVKKSKFCQRSLDKASEVLAGLHAVNPKLVFSKSQLIDVCRQLYDKNAHLATWKMEEKWVCGWIDQMKNRLSNLCHAVAQGEAKAKPPKWVADLPWNVAEGEQPSAEAKGKAAEEPAPATGKTAGSDKTSGAAESDDMKYMRGWHRQFRTAWRVPQKKSKLGSKTTVVGRTRSSAQGWRSQMTWSLPIGRMATAGRSVEWLLQM